MVVANVNAVTYAALSQQVEARIQQYDICVEEYRILYALYESTKDIIVKSHLASALHILFNNLFKIRSGHSSPRCHNTRGGKLDILKRLFCQVNILSLDISFLELAKNTHYQKNLQLLLMTDRDNWIFTVDEILFYGHY